MHYVMWEAHAQVEVRNIVKYAQPIHTILDRKVWLCINQFTVEIMLVQASLAQLGDFKLEKKADCS